MSDNACLRRSAVAVRVPSAPPSRTGRGQQYTKASTSNAPATARARIDAEQKTWRGGPWLKRTRPLISAPQVLLAALAAAALRYSASRGPTGSGDALKCQGYQVYGSFIHMDRVSKKVAIPTRVIRPKHNEQVTFEPKLQIVM